MADHLGMISGTLSIKFRLDLTVFGDLAIASYPHAIGEKENTIDRPSSRTGLKGWINKSGFIAHGLPQFGAYGAINHQAAIEPKMMK